MKTQDMFLPYPQNVKRNVKPQPIRSQKSAYRSQTCMFVLSIQGLNMLVILYLTLQCSYKTVCHIPTETNVQNAAVTPSLQQRALIHRLYSAHKEDPHEIELLDLQPYWDKQPFHNAPHFPRLLNRDDREKMIQLMSSMDMLFQKHKVEYIMYWGTLLGSYIAHGPLAWDDDLDIMVNGMDLLKIHRLNFTGIFAHHGIGYHCRAPMGTDGDKPYALDYFRVKIKLYPLDGKTISGIPWKWPFVDITPFDSNTTHVWNYNTLHKPIMIPRLFVYPLHKRPFGPLWLPAPRDAFLALRANYLNNVFGKNSAFVCQRSYWHHMNETHQAMLEVPCGSLTPYYPFVRREKIKGGVKEILELDDEEIYSIELQEPYHNQKYPYRLPWRPPQQNN